MQIKLNPLVWLLCALVVACASPPVAQVPQTCPVLQPPPPEVMLPQQPNFSENLTQRFSLEKPPEPTK